MQEVERKRMDKIQLEEVESEIIRYKEGGGKEKVLKSESVSTSF